MPGASRGEPRTSPVGRTGSFIRTLDPAEFDVACVALMHLIESDYAPDLVVGVRTGGLLVAEAMTRAASASVPAMPLTCRRPSTGLKSRIPGLQAMLGAMPEALRNGLRHAEHHLMSRRRKSASSPPVDRAEAEAIGTWLAETPDATRVLVADDAVDTGVTLATVLRTLRDGCPPGTQLRTAVITVTLDNPVVEPDYALYRGVLCRFPWSFDASR